VGCLRSRKRCAGWWHCQHLDPLGPQRVPKRACRSFDWPTEPAPLTCENRKIRQVDQRGEAQEVSFASSRSGLPASKPLAAGGPSCHDDVATHRNSPSKRPWTAADCNGPLRTVTAGQDWYLSARENTPCTATDRHEQAWAVYGSESRSEARRQPTDQYDAALDTTDDHVGAAQWHWPTSSGTSNQRSGRRGPPGFGGGLVSVDLVRCHGGG
jgi:hypothetical protein